MATCKEANTPMATSCYLDKDESGEKVNQTMYRGMIGSLLYFTTSRADIMQSVCVCARYQENPKESHLTTAKRVLKYLKGTTSFGLWYPSDATPSLIGYSDADYGGCKIDRKSTNGTCHFLGCSLVSWHSKKQACVAFSTTEAEYIVAGNCCA
ncbi:secreted RxLR effector protein 161-like [Vigna angularis]|uniref:secreted RxLR effector protein 161-like n=1 Tax=Phaseolus angularis TaxID=3914 RepID=UPI00080A64A9|nr:secreted RxLR effector protein 161-like [Vigna angularis]